MTIDAEKVTALLKDYMEKYPSVVMLGGEHLYHNEKAKEEALDLIVEIFDLIARDSENEDLDLDE